VRARLGSNWDQDLRPLLSQDSHLDQRVVDNVRDAVLKSQQSDLKSWSEVFSSPVLFGNKVCVPVVSWESASL